MTTLLWTLVAVWVVSTALDLYGLGTGKYPTTMEPEAAALTTAVRLVFLIWALILLLP
jgi:hypothetical protein